MTNEPLAKDYATPEDYLVAHEKWASDNQKTDAKRPYGYEKNWGRDDRKVSDLDFDRINLLMNVIASAVLHGPAFSNIIAEANFELLDINTKALEYSTGRAKAKADADAKAKADEIARTDELAKVEEDKLRKARDEAEDAKIKTAAQVAAAGQAKAEADAKLKADADAKAGRPVDAPVPAVDPVPQSEFVNNTPKPFISPVPNEAPISNTTFTSDNNGRRI